MNVTKKTQDEPAHHDSGDPRRIQYLTPLADVESTEDGYIIRAEMPGVDKAGLEITVENGELTLLGHRRSVQFPGQPAHLEIRHNDFRRVYELDPAIDTAKISARMDQGLLILTLTKAERVKPRKIAVE
jgi:HSP20 family protein